MDRWTDGRIDAFYTDMQTVAGWGNVGELHASIQDKNATLVYFYAFAETSLYSSPHASFIMEAKLRHIWPIELSRLRHVLFHITVTCAPMPPFIASLITLISFSTLPLHRLARLPCRLSALRLLSTALIDAMVRVPLSMLYPPHPPRALYPPLLPHTAVITIRHL
ncbi:hypothetical protein TcWFU_002741 [Taenia crassiceps]|uniref:Uncharacterized protein n=1 Tax=Taenia crassiceps TaxID=6207 RepID=A0ABR4QAB2_9CEST